MTKKSPFVITISRQLGSGGAYIGQVLAKKLNMQYADREIICRAARQLSTLVEALEPHEEKVRSFWQSFVESFAYFAAESYTPPIIVPTNQQLFQIESEIIRAIAKEQPAVIIGRCASQILGEHPNHVSLFLHGDMTFRSCRVQELYKVTGETAEKMIHKTDHERSRYIYKFTGKDWKDSRQYNLCIDTSKLAIDKCVDIILNYLELGDFSTKKNQHDA